MESTAVNLVETIFYWFLALIPALLYPILVWPGYGHVLKQKRREITNILTDGGGQKIFERYKRAYEPGDESWEDAVDRLFTHSYGWRAYVPPLGIILIVSVMASAAALAYGDFPMGLTPILTGVINESPKAVFAGVLGAYVWSLLEILWRYRELDLTPESLHFTWLRLLAAPIVGALSAATLQSPFDVLVAFGLGALPVKQLMDFVKASAKEQLKISTRTEPAELANLHSLQGLTEAKIVRLEEEGIGSVQHLAMADPIKLLVKTGFEWKLILDIIDQALLYNYVEEKIKVLRPIGIRGAIELIELCDETEPCGAGMAELVAKKLEQEPIAVKKLRQTLEADPQVDFVWELWGAVWHPEENKQGPSGPGDPPVRVPVGETGELLIPT